MANQKVEKKNTPNPRTIAFNILFKIEKDNRPQKVDEKLNIINPPCVVVQKPLVFKNTVGYSHKSVKQSPYNWEQYSRRRKRGLNEHFVVYRTRGNKPRKPA